MDNSHAKEILSAYRHNGKDANDETFKEALQQCQNDPLLKDWFQSEQSFDAAASKSFNAIHGPEEGKQATVSSCLFEIQNRSQNTKRSRWIQTVIGVGIAATLALGIFVLFSFPAGSSTIDREHFSLAELADRAMPFDYRAKDSINLIAWLQDQGAPVPSGYHKLLDYAEAYGCRVFNESGGGVISLICLEVDSEIVHIFTFDERSRQLLDTPNQTWTMVNDWNVYSIEENDQLLTLVTRAEPESIQRFL